MLKQKKKRRINTVETYAMCICPLNACGCGTCTCTDPGLGSPAGTVAASNRVRDTLFNNNLSVNRR